MEDNQSQNQTQQPEKINKSGLKQLWTNLRNCPRNIRDATVRRGQLDSPRAQSQAVFQNVFLHIHSVRVHRWSLKKNFTLGLGIASASLFIILAATGILLMLYYKPTVTEAYNSVKDIHYIVPGGRLLRNVHRWAGHLMIVTVFLHMARVFFTRSYLKPREFNWLIGTGLLALTLVLGYTGYCLPWDQLAYWATVIGANIAGSPRELTDALNITQYFDLGEFQRTLFLGSRQVGGETILRFYWLHCIFLPIMTSILMTVHIWRIRKDGGLSRPLKFHPDELKHIPKDDIADNSFQNEKKTYTLMCLVPDKSRLEDHGPEHTVMSCPHLFRAEMAVFMFVLAILLVWGIFIDAPLSEAANPNVPENPAKAPWYFLGLQELVAYSAFAGGLLIPVLSILALASIPFLDREEGISGRWPNRFETGWIIISCLFSLLVSIIMLVVVVNFGWLRDWIPNINQLWIILCNPGTVLLGFFFIYSVFVVKLTDSTRLGAVATFCCFMVSFIVLTYFGSVHRGPNWDFYWWPSQWPAH